MDDPGSPRTCRRVGVAKEMSCRALMRIVEAVAIATTHTYTSSKYTTFLKEFGIVEEDSEPFGCNRTGAMKDFIYDGNSVSASPIQRVMHQETLEKYRGPVWTYDAMPRVVKDWLSAEGLNKEKTLASAGGRDISLAKAIHTETSRLGGKGLDRWKESL